MNRKQTKGREVLNQAVGALQALEERRLLSSTWTPADGNAFQTALNSAQLGDTIILNAGSVYSRAGGFTLPNKTTGSGWITIQSSNLASLPGPGVRVTPADAVNMPRLQSLGGNASVIYTATSAHHFKMIGLDFDGPAATAQVPDPHLTALISLGTDVASQSTIESEPHHILIDRCYMHPDTPDRSVRRAIALNSAYTDVINSWVADIHEAGSDSQAIGGYNGSGHYNIINNHLEGASENIMFGGATTRVPVEPTDIVIRGNEVIKPLKWMGAGYNTKNLFELKQGHNVLVEGNIFENCWVDGQSGVAIVLKLGNLEDTYWNTTDNITFRNNIVRNAVGGVTLQGRDYAARKPGSTTDPLDPGGLVRNLTFTNNVFEAISAKFLYLTDGPKNVTFDHNTIFQKSNAIDIDTNAATYPDTAFKFNNNIIGHNQYGVFSSTGIGNATFDAYLSDPGASFNKNVLVDVNYLYRNFYTHRPNNYLIVSPNNDSTIYTPDPELWANVGFVNYNNGNGGDYHLSVTSPYKNAGTDGTDIGANIDLVNASTAGAISGQWSSSFATLVGSTLMVNFDGTNTPITLGNSGSNITVTKGATTQSFPGVSSIFVTGSSADDVLQFNGAIAKPFTFSNENGDDDEADTLRVMAGTQTFAGDLASPLKNVDLAIDAGAGAVFNSSQHLGDLVVNGNASVAAGGNKALTVKSVSVGANGKLDLLDNDMVVDYVSGGGGTSPAGTWNGNSYTGVSGLVATGRAGGAWNGNGGIVSSLAAGSNLKTLAVSESTSVTSPTPSDAFSAYFQSRFFSGESVDDTAVLIKFTYGGDANMDGKLNVDDYGRIDLNIPLGSRSWFNGDFNYDGKVNVDDYGILDSNVGIQGVPL